MNLPPEKPKDTASPPKNLEKLKQMLKERWRLRKLLEWAEEAQGEGKTTSQNLPTNSEPPGPEKKPSENETGRDKA